MGELWLKIAQTSGAKIYSLLTGIVTLSLTARWLGPEGRGTIAAVVTWVNLFSSLASFGLGTVVFHRATKMRDKPWIASTLGSLGFLAVMFSLTSWGIAACLYLGTTGAVFNHLSSPILSVGFLSLPFMIWEQYASSLLMAVNQIGIYNRAQIMGRTVGVILVVLLLSLNWGVYGVLVASLASQMTVAQAGITYLFKRAEKPVWPDKTVICELLKGGIKLQLGAIGSSLKANLSDILLINYYRGVQETGYYQLAIQLLNLLLIIPQSASLVVSTKVAELGPDLAWPYQRNLLLLLTAGMTGVGVIAGILAPLLIPLVAGVAFVPSVKVFQLLLFGVIGMTFASVMASQWIGRGLFWQISAITLSVGLLNAILNLILIPQLGMYGAVWATTATYMISILGNGLMAIWVNKRYKTYVP